MGWMHTARFLTTAAQLHHLPPIDVPEIAFVGRSNAGKSTSINTLTQQKRLAFASKTPGRTQSINLFALGKQGATDAVLADLPGYGYAAVPKEAKLRWQRVMSNYLMTRENLRGVVLLCDPRLGLTELDEILLDIIRPRVEEGLQFLVLLTKADKLTRAEANKALSIARLQAGGGEAKLFSALKKQGLDEVAQLLWRWVRTAPTITLAKPPSCAPSHWARRPLEAGLASHWLSVKGCSAKAGRCRSSPMGNASPSIIASPWSMSHSIRAPGAISQRKRSASPPVSALIATNVPPLASSWGIASCQAASSCAQ